MIKEEKRKVMIPSGFFGGGNCSTCVHANPHDRNARGEIKCDGSYGGYNSPEDRNGCFYYERR